MLGVTLLDLPPEVAAAYAVPDGIAGGAAVLGGASPSAGAFAGVRGGNSELQRLLHDSPEIDMSAALAIIHREHTGGQPAVPGSAGMHQDDGLSAMPGSVSAAAASTQAEPSRPPTLGRWTQGRAERLGGPPLNQLPVTDEGLAKTFSFSRPRTTAPTQPIGRSLSPRRQPAADLAGGASGSAVPLSDPLHSQDSEATAAAKALMNELSGSEDESEAPRTGGGWLGRTRAKKPVPGQYEAEMQREQAERERQRAEEQRNAGALAAAAAAAAAAAEADRRHEQQRQAEERAEQERMRAEAAARDEALRRAEAQRARDAAAAAEQEEARAAAQRDADRAAVHQAAVAEQAAKKREAAAAAAALAEQAHRQSLAADDRSRAAREVESNHAQSAAMDRAREHAADVADVQVR